MNVDKLVRMANQIADNFYYGGNREEAVAGVLDHVRRFWTVEMKKEIVAHAASTSDTGLNEIAATAVSELGKDEDYAA